MRKEWMFKLVGKEYFEVGKSRAKCCISIDAVSGFAYEYTIEVRIPDSTVLVNQGVEMVKVSLTGTQLLSKQLFWTIN